MMEAILIGSIIASIIAGLGIAAIIAMYIIYRCTGGKKSLMWYIRHIYKLFNGFLKHLSR